MYVCMCVGVCIMYVCMYVSVFMYVCMHVQWSPLHFLNSLTTKVGQIDPKTNCFFLLILINGS